MLDPTTARTWLADSPFSRDLALELHDLTEDSATARFNNTERLAGYGALHGGAIASASALVPQTLLSASDPAPAPTTVSHHAIYARVARSAAFDVRSRLVRSAPELRYVETQLTDEAHRDVASAAPAVEFAGHRLVELTPGISPLRNASTNRRWSSRTTSA